jgi:hypothetical protein
MTFKQSDAISGLTDAFDHLQTGAIDGDSSKAEKKLGVTGMVRSIIAYAEATYGEEWRTQTALPREEIWAEDINPQIFGPAEQNWCEVVYKALVCKLKGEQLTDEQNTLLINYPYLTTDMLPMMVDSKSNNFKQKFTIKGKEYHVVPNAVSTYKNAMKNAFIRGDLSEDMESKKHMATGKLNVDISDDERFRQKLKGLKNFISKQKDEQIRDNWRNLAIDELTNL